MTRPEDERPAAPRCECCGRFKQVLSEAERVVVYECCGLPDTVFRPQFRQPPERLRGDAR